MHALKIDSICANTPAAKGRVERANLTLQDRLVKELRLAGICDMDAANRFAPGFIEDFNRRFAKTPASEHNAHRLLAAHESLDDEFRWQETRKVSRQMTLNYKRVLYRITPCKLAQQAVGNRVLVSEAEDGAVRLFFKGQQLQATPFPRDGLPTNAPVVPHKLLDHALRHARELQAQRETARAKTKRDKRLVRAKQQAAAVPSDPLPGAAE